MVKKTKVKFNKKRVKSASTAVVRALAPASLPPPMPQREKSMLSSLGAMALRGLGGVGGAILGNPSAGYNAGADISKWLGMGDYELQSNSVVAKAAKGVPFMHKSGQTTRIQHREFIQDIVTSSISGQFNIFQLPLNPGQSQTFPWLSVIASQYQEYEFKGLVFHYVSTSGESVASTNTAIGSVIMATQYRSTQAPFSNKTVMLNEYFSNDTKPSEDAAHPVECDPKENPFQIQYVRTGLVPSGEDEKMYDLGTFNLATVGYPGTSSTVGELWCTYDIELKKPQIVAGTLIQDAHYTTTGSLTTANPFGTSVNVQYDNIGLIVQASGVHSISFPVTNQAVNYVVSVVYQGATAYSGNGFAFNSYSSSLNIYRGSGAYNSNYTVGTGSAVTTQFVATTASSVTLPPVITLNVPGTLTGATQCDIYICQLNPAAI